MNWQTIVSNWKDQLNEKSFHERFRLFEAEKKQIFQEARRLLRAFLEEQDALVSKNLPLSDVVVDMDVAYWVRGKVRGSRILLGKPLYVALKECVALTARDKRFAPLLLSELNDTRISITFFSPVRRPVTEDEWQENEIDPTRAYVFSGGGLNGWYLPAVHNARSFQNLQEMLTSLARDKAGYTGELSYRQFQSFRVIDLMESEDHRRVLEMTGPLVKQEGAMTEERLRMMLREGMAHLVRLQTEEGNIPAVVNSRGETVKEKDPARLASAGLALTLAGRVLENTGAIEAGSRTASTAERLLQEGTWTEEYLALTRAYLGQLFIALGEREKVNEYAEPLLALDATSFHPITALQRLNFLLQAIQFLKKEFDRKILGAEIEQYTRDFFRLREEQETQLATYPELAHVLGLAGEIFGEAAWAKKSEEVVSWYEGQQLSLGAFPIRPHSSFAYTRGTGKIFEVLALARDLEATSIQKVLQWLAHMQYDRENVFFMPPEFQGEAQGGFRHDAFHRELWIDAVTHFLIGGARLLEQKK